MIRFPRILAICALLFVCGAYIAGLGLSVCAALGLCVFLLILMLRKGSVTAAVVAAALFVGFFYTNFIYDKNIRRAEKLCESTEGFYCRVISLSKVYGNLRTLTVDTDGGKMSLYVSGGTFSYGDVLYVEATPSVRREFSRVADGVYLSATAKSIRKEGTDLKLYNIYDAAFWVKEKLLAAADRLWSGEELMFARSVLFGASNYSSDEFKEKLSRGSISHLVAISGLHVSFMAYAVLYVVMLFTRKRIFRLLCLIPALFFVIMTGASPSAVRAFIMFAIFITAKVTHSYYDAYTSLGFAAAAIVIYNPLSVYSYSFMLSFAAVLGLITFSSPIAERLSALPRSLSEAISVTLSAQTFTLPILALCFKRIPLIALTANLFAVPLLPFIMGFGYAAVIFKLLGLELFCARIADFLISFVLKTAETAGGLPLSSVEVEIKSPLCFVLFFVFFIAALYLFLKRHKWLPSGTSALLAFAFLIAAFLFRPNVADGIYYYGGSLLVKEKNSTVLFLSDAENGATLDSLSSLRITEVDAIAVTDESFVGDISDFVSKLSPAQVIVKQSVGLGEAEISVGGGEKITVGETEIEVFDDDDGLSYIVNAFNRRIYVLSGSLYEKCDIAYYLSKYPEGLHRELDEKAYCVTCEAAKKYLSPAEMEEL